MKIVIIDNDYGALLSMVELLRGAGHEVKGVLVSNRSARDGVEVTTDLTRIHLLLMGFGPDLVLLDHDLGDDNEHSGETLVERARIPKQKLIGTSCVYLQSYCAGQFTHKAGIGHNRLYDQTLLRIVHETR
jgi:hypothetical protein